MKKIQFILSLSLASSVVMADDLGKKTYENACSTCHAPNVAKGMHAPQAFDKKAWELRFQKAEVEAKKNSHNYPTTMDYLLYQVTIGKGLMHHGGLCKEANIPKQDCSKKALEAAILYMKTGS